MKKTLTTLVLTAAAAVLASCSSMMPAPRLSDTQQPLPADYRNWPTFLTAVQRPDAKQVRDIYVNPTGARATREGGFGHGSTFVMENWSAKANADGSLVNGADGKLVKDKLLRVFVMGKNAGWGADVQPPEMRTGEWIYTAYDGAGKPVADPIPACRACHLAAANKDFVIRYDEYFDKRRN